MISIIIFMLQIKKINSEDTVRIYWMNMLDKSDTKSTI